MGGVGGASDNSHLGYADHHLHHRDVYSPVSLDGDLPAYSDPGASRKIEDAIDPVQSSSSPQMNSYLPEKQGNEPLVTPYSEAPERFHVFKSWRWEFVALCLSFGLVAAIFAILAGFRGKAVPDWGSAVNLSALLALLATILRANLVAVVGRIISQAKWAWFSDQKPRPLRHLQDFDSGSRSALGSARLIRTAHKDNLMASISAALMIISLAIGPFVQQAIRTTVCSHPDIDDAATLPYAHYVPRMGTYDDLPYPYGASRIEQDANLAIMISLARQQSQGSQIQPVCSTGNCTFPGGNPIDDATFRTNGSQQSSYSTIGLCSKCVEVSSLVKLISSTGGTFNGTRDDAYARTYGLPNHLNISIQAYGTFLEVQTDAELDWAGTALPSEMIAYSRFAFANVSILSFTQVGCEDVTSWTPKCPINSIDRTGAANATGRAGLVAVTCIVYPCVRTFVPTITSNVLQEPEIESTPVWPDLLESPASDAKSLNAYSNASPGLNNFHYVGVQTPCQVDGTIYTAENISTAQNATKLRLYQPTSDGTFDVVQNTTAPEECIFRHNAVFGSYLTHQFQNEIFTGDCEATPQNGDVSCSSNGADQTFGKWMELVYNEGNAALTTISSFFDSFVMMMTNEYRVSLGTSSYNPQDYVNTTIPKDLPAGMVNGTVWSTTICTSMRWEWLLLPSLVVALTGVLFCLAVYRSWRRRYVEPVFKDSILPILFYRQRFQVERDPTLEALGQRPEHDFDPADMDGKSPKLMEISQLKDIATAVPARFRWDELTDEEARNQGLQTATEHTSLRLRTRRKTAVEKMETDSLLDVGR